LSAAFFCISPSFFFRPFVSSPYAMYVLWRLLNRDGQAQRPGLRRILPCRVLFLPSLLTVVTDKLVSKFGFFVAFLFRVIPFKGLQERGDFGQVYSCGFSRKTFLCFQDPLSSTEVLRPVQTWPSSIGPSTLSWPTCPSNHR